MFWLSFRVSFQALNSPNFQYHQEVLQGNLKEIKNFLESKYKQVEKIMKNDI